MKTHKRFLSFVILALFSFSLFANDLQQEEVKLLYSAKSTQQATLIQPGESVEMDVDFKEGEYPLNRILRVVGGAKLPGKFAQRGETMFRASEYLIDDCLDSIHVSRDKYSLYFGGNNDPFERHTYMRISAPDIKAGKLTIENRIKTNKFRVADNGNFGVELQLYFTKEGRHPHDVYDAPDSVVFFPFPGGTKKFRTVKNSIVLPANIATVVVKIGGTHFEGEAWIEAPRMIQDKKQALEMPFVHLEQEADDYNYWVGVNLSSRSWPRWQLTFNEDVIFEDKVFDRASDIADFYINMPQLKGRGKLKLTLLPNQHAASFPYKLERIQLIEESKRDVELVSVPKYAAKGDTLGVLIEINKPGVHLSLASTAHLTALEADIRFDKTGLYVVNFRAEEIGKNLPITFTYANEKRTAYVEQILIKEKDWVNISSGDEIYLDKVYDPYDYFFKWYFRDRIGNFYQFRPSYQWSGLRIVDEPLISHYTQLLNQLKVPFAWQVEGRTLASTRINASLATLESPMFRGKQAHENDGGYYYWQHFQYEGFFSDMAARARPYGGIFAKHRPIYTDKGIFIHYDPYAVKNMADGAQYLVSNFAYSRGESTRHTGPSVMFRYLYQAGYEWLGAEQMYGPENTIMSALRGASLAYGKTDFGSLHAVQWGSSPFTDPIHSLRFYNSLAVAYMHGSSSINTEEGLWTDEYANDRYTKAGEEHLFAQHQILDFIETHTRRGEFYTKIAVMQGRNDAWKCFGRTSIWSQNGEKWAFNQATESFDLLKIFYPGNVINHVGPEGWFTHTPYGAIDLLPIEASEEVMRNYGVMIFLGWNSFAESDFERIEKFVANGGSLLLTAAHLNTELQPDLPTKLPENSAVLTKLLGENYQQIDEKVELAYGKGKVIYFPQTAYPINEQIKVEYENMIRELAANIAKAEEAKAWIQESPSIDFTVWDAKDRRTIYALNIDWKSDNTTHKANLVLNNQSFTFDVPRYALRTLTSSLNLGVLPQANTSDVLEIKENDAGWTVVVQTTDADEVIFFNGLSGETHRVLISQAGVHTIELNN